MQLNALQDHPSLGFVDWTLRGIGQVVFQNNPLSGLVILFAILVNSHGSMHLSACLALSPAR